MSSKDTSLESQEQDCFKIARLFSPFREKKAVVINEHLWERFNQMMTCPICLDLLNDPMFLRCSHRFCKKCIQTVLRTFKNKQCPTCQAKITTRRDLFSDNCIEKAINVVFGDIQVYQQQKNRAEERELALVLENAIWIKNSGKRDRQLGDDDQTGSMTKMYKSSSGQDTRINLQPSSTDQEPDTLILAPQTIQTKKPYPRVKRTKQMQEQRQEESRKKDIVYTEIEIRKLQGSEYIPSIEFNMVRICLDSHLEKISLFIAEDLNMNLNAVHLYIQSDPKITSPIELVNTRTIQDINSQYWHEKDELLVCKKKETGSFKEQPFVRFVRQSRRRRIMYYYINFQHITTL